MTITKTVFPVLITIYAIAASGQEHKTTAHDDAWYLKQAYQISQRESGLPNYLVTHRNLTQAQDAVVAACSDGGGEVTHQTRSALTCAHEPPTGLSTTILWRYTFVPSEHGKTRISWTAAATGVEGGLLPADMALLHYALLLKRLDQTR